MPLTGNKGEWSEIYVFLRLLVTGKLFAADADLNKISGTFYNILNILRNENGQQLEFHVDSNRGRVSVVDSDTNVVLISLPLEISKKLPMSSIVKLLLPNLRLSLLLQPRLF